MIDLKWENYEIISSIDDLPSDRRLLVLQRKDGVFCFAEQMFWHPAPEDEGLEIDWAVESLSGLYGSAQEAEIAALREVPWLRDQRRN